MILEKGVHLHWMVPTFLGKEYGGMPDAAPNRWLVEKNNEKKWLVVSDHVHEAEISEVIGEFQFSAFQLYPPLWHGQTKRKIPFGNYNQQWLAVANIETQGAVGGL